MEAELDMEIFIHEVKNHAVVWNTLKEEYHDVVQQGYKTICYITNDIRHCFIIVSIPRKMYYILSHVFAKRRDWLG